MRQRMGDAALAAARTIGYYLDRHRRIPARGRRLLLPGSEHPPAGRASRHRGDHRLDLVREQIARRRGRSAGVHASAICAIDGHAIEARLYAEDPQQNFLPSPGTVQRVGAAARATASAFDSGIESGSDVGIEFDRWSQRSSPTRRRGARRRQGWRGRWKRRASRASPRTATSSSRRCERRSSSRGETTTDFIERCSRRALGSSLAASCMKPRSSSRSMAARRLAERRPYRRCRPAGATR